MMTGNQHQEKLDRKQKIIEPTIDEQPTSGKWNYFIKSLIAGSISGGLAKTLTAPLDRVKILFQAHNPHYYKYSQQRFGPFKAVYKIYQREGVYGMYQGHGVMLLRIIPSAAVRFMTYEQIRMYLIPSAEYDSPWRHFLAGSLAGNAAVLLTYPLEVIRSRMAYQIRLYNSSYGISPTIAEIYKEGGLNGFYKGFGATMCGVVIYAGTSFSSYHYMKKQCIEQSLSNPYLHWLTFTDGQGEQRLIIPAHLLVGGLSGILGQSFAYPFDTIRHRMQLHGVAARMAMNNQAPYPFYRHTLDALKIIVSTEGWRTFFIGLSINWYKTIPANAFAFVIYDYLKRYLDMK
ncbi:hypothetical protein MP228_003405 [Amoeboaphelidium protococcarum]|nr:hypothetical protein MP228_003405 [Amoeboaphelidium protococcarum]